jgi:hypothetical protein
MEPRNFAKVEIPDRYRMPAQPDFRIVTANNNAIGSQFVSKTN